MNESTKFAEEDEVEMTTTSDLNEVHFLPDDVPVTQESTCLRSFAGVAGNVMEWYDFAIFGFFGDVIGEVFFPKQAGHAAIVESFAVFGGAFLMRPVGGVVLGYIGDVYGRKKALEISIFLMAIPTFLMGLLPSYKSIGWPAIVMLVVVRLLQGMSVGGQLMASMVFTLENAPRNKWGYHGSFVLAAANLGTLLGGIVGYMMRKLCDEDQLISWGWRVPFLSGILVSVFGIYLKFYVPESDFHLASSQDQQKQNPLVAAFSKENRKSLLATVLVPMFWSGGFYTCFVWMAIYMTDLIESPVQDAFLVNSLSLFLSCILVFPIAGILSDIFGRRNIMTIGAVLMILFAPIMVGGKDLFKLLLVFSS
uniref:Major facilitator superfamily (MFS) profile domain-containing protein n=1 Tax=Corethron hystrix TaxID=216773 RepID=A0A7S1BFK1_9STRA|mmetsp:Transcript_24154/g.54901  ORF Transcript_24154/g.54901 Transcript_24154/m.54901 type:complete len:365 (+) Transcript_24154:91-1185(+)